MTRKRIIKLTLILSILGLTVYYFYPDKKLPTNINVDSIVVFKSQRQLLVYSNDKLIKTYKISLGGHPKGDKKYEGDKKTPEGVYYISDKNHISGYHKNLAISYPNAQDIKDANALGKLPGGDIKIHGLRNKLGFIGKFHRWFDWTAGCIALTDEEVDELNSCVKIGTRIEINP